MKQESLFGSRWEQPHLDRSLVNIPGLEDAHISNATEYLGWAWRMAAQGHDPRTPDRPMKLPPDGRGGPNYDTDRITAERARLESLRVYR